MINTPSNVTKKFWDALSENNTEKAKEYSVKGTLDSTSVIKNAKINIIEISRKHRIDNEIAYVDTVVEVTKNGKKRKYEFETVVIKENNLWKVDFNQTQIEMIGYSLRQFEKSLKDVGKDMGEAIGEAMREMGKAVGDAMEDMANKTEEAIEKHRKKDLTENNK